MKRKKFSDDRSGKISPIAVKLAKIVLTVSR